MNLDFKKNNGLIPVIVQHVMTSQVLMLGYMNQEALEKTKREGMVTFFSRSKNRLWTKGEESGNFLKVDHILEDCDKDALLIKVQPNGPTCHKGTTSCFNENTDRGFLYELEQIINKRIDDNAKDSYSNELFMSGINRVTQKVGEEAIELIIEAKDENEVLFVNEVADFFYHY